jgi:hypothetical protein
VNACWRQLQAAAAGNLQQVLPGQQLLVAQQQLVVQLAEAFD